MQLYLANMLQQMLRVASGHSGHTVCFRFTEK